MSAFNSNYFGLLTTSQDPDQLVSSEANKAKNRKKREKQKQKQREASLGQGPEDADNGIESNGRLHDRKKAKHSLAQLQSDLLNDSRSSEFASVWDHWLRQVRQYRQGPPPKSCFACTNGSSGYDAFWLLRKLAALPSAYPDTRHGPPRPCPATCLAVMAYNRLQLRFDKHRSDRRPLAKLPSYLRLGHVLALHPQFKLPSRMLLRSGCDYIVTCCSVDTLVWVRV